MENKTTRKIDKILEIIIKTLLVFGVYAFFVAGVEFANKDIKHTIFFLGMTILITKVLVSFFYDIIASFLNKYFKTSLERKLDI